MMGVGFPALESVLEEQFRKKEKAVIDENISLARSGYDYATQNFKPFAWPLPMTDARYAVLSGNAAMAMGGAAAGASRTRSAAPAARSRRAPRVPAPG